MIFEELHTDRLILRKFTKETFDDVYSLAEKQEQMQWLGLASLEQLEAERKKYDEGLVTFNKKLLYFHLVDKTNLQVIGWCGYHTWYIQHNRAELGYWLYDDNYKQKGLMTEALEVILQYGFNNMKLNRVEAFVGEDNVASTNTLKKFGFSFEGIAREHYRNKKDIEDSLFYSLLAREYVQNIKAQRLS